MQKLLKNKNILTIIISCIIIVILLVCSSFLRVLNKTIQNEYYKVKNELTGLEANPHIVIVELDEETFSHIWKFPFPRSIYAQVLKNIESYNSAVVAFDILFLDPSIPENDAFFAETIADYPYVVLGSSLDNKWNIHTPFSGLDPKTYTTWFLHPNIESSNKTVYSFSPRITDVSWKQYEHFTLQILKSFERYLYENTRNIPYIWEFTDLGYFFSLDRIIPLASKDSLEILINFIQPEKFTRISFVDLYDTQRLEKIDAEIGLRDKILLVWPASDGLKDEFFTPNGVEYGVNIHANILNTLLSERYMLYFDRHLEWILIFFLIILSVLANLSNSRKVLLVSNIAIVSIFWFIIPLSILLSTNLILNYPSEIILSLLLAFSSANIVKYLVEDQNKKKLNKALSEYVGSSIAEEILMEQGKVNLDGQEKKLVCFFSDIEGFTTMSEWLKPQELVQLLREYLSKMTLDIMEKWGHVDKFEGDAIMAIWGAFTSHKPEDYIKACEAALVQQQHLSDLNEHWGEKLWNDIHVRIGIHGGNAIVGNIWAEWQKMEFTALGDNINLASRLEGVNKFYGTYICVSEVVYDATHEYFVFRYLDEIRVKGKENSVKIYELIGEKKNIDSSHTQIYIRFMKAIEYYKIKNFSKAEEIFTELSLRWDKPSQVYVERCKVYKQTPPPEDWDGVWKMTEK